MPGSGDRKVRDRSAPSSQLSDSNKLEKAQQTKQRSRQQIRRLAIVGFFVIPLLTFGGFLGWRSLPPPNILLLVANFANSQHPDYRDDRQVTAKILQNLTIQMEPYADVKVQALDKTITEQQGSDFARTEGENKKAAIVIWGDYGVSPTNVLISVHFEVLKPPANLPKLGEEARGQAQNFKISQLDQFELQRPSFRRDDLSKLVHIGDGAV